MKTFRVVAVRIAPAPSCCSFGLLNLSAVKTISRPELFLARIRVYHAWQCPYQRSRVKQIIDKICDNFVSVDFCLKPVASPDFPHTEQGRQTFDGRYQVNLLRAVSVTVRVVIQLALAALMRENNSWNDCS
jgi:hypothetical protein